MASNPSQPSQSKGKTFYPKREFKKRSKSHTNNQMSNAGGSNDIMEKVTSEMNCPVCMKHLHEPIFMCETGHNICGICRKSLLLPVCPLCKSTVTGLRNFALEAISSKISIPCVNACYGCNFKCPQSTMSDHLGECKFQPSDCPFKTHMEECSWSGSQKKLPQHFEKKHPQNMKLKPGEVVIFSDFSVDVPCRNLQLIPFDNNFFVYYVDINVEKKTAFWVIQMIGTSEDAQKWKYDFTFKNNEKSKYINFSEKCESASIPLKELFESGNCVGIPLAILKNFIYKDNSFSFKFFIRPTAFFHKPKSSDQKKNYHDNKFFVM